MDSFSQRSHARAVAARAAGAFGEITPVVSNKGEVFEQDDGVREDASLSGLAKLKPVFDKPAGNITAGNSSQVTDGAAMVLLASEEAVARWNLKPIARLTDLQWAGLDPAEMGLGPVHAATPLLQRNQIRLEDLDLIEINEAFAAQVIACQRAWESEAYCREQLGLSAALGSIDENKLNVDGGAVSIGHPVGASGARITLHLAQALRARGLRRGLAAICIGGGQGGAILVEAL
jgi:acetyl-CoA C-acetyltransferase